MQPKGVVFEGKTLDEAVRKGMEALGLTRAEVMITVLEEGSGGFLGIGARPYRVRMMPRPARQLSERPPGREREGRSERGDRGDRGGRDRRPGRGDGRSRAGRVPESRGSRVETRGGGRGDGRGEAPGDRGADVRGGRGGDGRREPRVEGRSRGDSPPAERPAPAPREELSPRPQDAMGEGQEGRGRRRRRGRPGERETQRSASMEEPDMSHSGEPATAALVAAPRMPEERRPYAAAPESDHEMSAGDLERTARQVTEDLLGAMGFEATVTARVDGDTAEVRAEVPQQSDLLAGPKGEVRQALQHLLNRTLNRGGGSRYHLQLEINDFWQQREDELRAMALQLANDAVADGTEKLTEYLNSQERRVVHMSLRDHPAVSTHAIGDGLIKKIAITPGGELEAPRSEE
jgi:spoIIIJ-associated protein